jgi:Tfp pilus assembly protein PilF
LRARALHRQRGEGLMQAIDLFQQALAIDPNFAPAWAGLSHSYIVVINYVSVEDMEKLGDVFSKSLASAEKALELDPGLATALHAMGNNLLFRVEWAEAETYYKRALELDPDSADIMEDYVSLLNNSWQLSTARSVAEHMIELDPYVSVFHHAMIAVLDSQGELELRDEHIRQALEINPDMGNIQTYNLNRLLQERRYEKARDYARQMNTFRYGSVENLHQLIDWVENPAQQPGPGFMEALGNDASVALIAGRYDLWLASIEAAGAIWPEWEVVTSINLLAPMTTPELMHQYRADPRTKEFLNRLRLPDYWRQVGWPEQCQPISETDFECH